MIEPTLWILLVDDEEGVRRPLAERLRKKYHYQVDVAGDGSETKRLLKKSKGRYDVAVIDQVLEGGISGLDLLHHIKSQYPNIQVIIFTAWGLKEEEGVNIIRQGAYRYISKTNYEELALTIRFAAEENWTRLERQYMAALVKVSQGLTQTTLQDEQLRVAWDFVHEQLDVSTFFIGIYSPENKRISFPLAYDENQQVELSDTLVEKSRREWGLAGYVVKTGEEILWSTFEEMKRLNLVKKIAPIIVGKTSASGFFMPLKIGGQIRGVMSAQSYHAHVFTPVVQNALRALSAQLSVALENSELFAEAKQRTTEIERQASSLAALQGLALTINSSLELNKILTKTCKTASRFFQADHTGLVIFDADFKQGTVEAEYPNLNIGGTQIPLRGILAEEKLIQTLEPLVIYDVRLEESLGMVRDILLGLNIESTLIVPVVGKAGLLGSFSLDAIKHKRNFTIEEIRLCKTFADQVAVAIENARLFSQVNVSKEKLNALIENTFDAMVAIDENSKITTFNHRAEQMFGWKSEEMLGHTVRRLYSTVEKAREVFNKIDREGAITGRSLELVHRDGTLIPVLLSATVIRDSQHKLGGQFGVIRDLREVKLREQLLVALDEASRDIRAEKEPAKLLPEVVRLSAQLMGCTAGGLFINYPYIEELEMTAVYGLPINLVGSRSPYEGLIGLIAQTGTTQMISHYSDEHDREAIFKNLDFKTVVGLPLKYLGEVEAVLFVADTVGLHEFDKNNLEILERFVAQASMALHTSQLMSKEQRRFSQLSILHRISDYIQGARDLDKILHVVLTAVTAGYGLGFNRAALLLLDSAGKNLVGKVGIGYLKETEAREDWKLHHQRGLEDFGKYLIALEEGTLPLTPVGKNIPMVVLSVRQSPSDALSRVLLERHWALITQRELSNLPQGFVQAIEPALPFIIIPMLARGQVVGLLVADNKFTQAPITREDINSLVTLANTASVAISNVQLFREVEAAQEKIRISFEASNALVLSQPTIRLLEDIIYQTQLAAGASWVSVVLIDELGLARNLFTTGPDNKINIRDIIRPNGISKQVMRSGEFEFIEDTQLQRRRVNKRMLRNKVGAALCLPFAVQGKRIGVVWIHYDKPRHFPKYEVEAIQLFVNQAAIAYDNAHKMEALEQMRQAAEALSGVTGWYKVLNEIVQRAKDVLGADSVMVRSFDALRAEFTPEGFASVGIPKKVSDKFRKEAPGTAGTAYTIMEQGWIPVTDVADENQYPYIGKHTKELLNKINAHSFQGIALTAGNEKLGVLYANYRYKRYFSEDEEKIARTFANHAALALKNANLLEELGNALKQVTRARNTAQVVAEVTALEELDGTLDSIVKGTQNTLSCDMVTLYTYDNERGEFSFPPAMVGVNDKDKVLGFGFVAKDSLVYKVIKLDDIYVAEDTEADPLLRSPFSSREGAKSTIAVPLIAKGQKVGVLFVNYTSPHSFTAEDVTNVKLFAHQAAIAIENARLYNAAKRRADNLDAILRVSRTAISSLDLQRILTATCQAAVDLLKVDHSGLVLFDENLMTGKVCAEFPEMNITGLVLPMHGVPAEERLIASKEPLIVTDLRNEPGFDSVRDILAKFDIRSMLITPIVHKERILGSFGLDVMGYQRIFTEEEIELCRIFAAQVAVAIENAQQYDELRQTKGLVGSRTALAWMGMASNAWRHSIEGHAINICNITTLLRQQLADRTVEEELSFIIEDKLVRIENLAMKIQEKPVTPPLSSEEGISYVSISDLVRERIKQLWKNEPYKSVHHQIKLNAEDSYTVLVSPEWLRRALDLLIDNAIEELEHLPRSRRLVTIEGQQTDNGIEIAVSDTGRGIPEEVKRQLFKNRILESGKGRGLGMGLLMAQAIMETYSGKIYCKNTNGNGTTMAIWLPLKAH